MQVSDQDLELLETYLDDELEARAADTLRARLSSEPALASAMDALRGERESRQSYFAALAPDTESIDRVMMGVRAGLTREAVWAQRAARLRVGGAIAASLLIGIMVGWNGRSRSNMPSVFATNARQAQPDTSGRIQFPGFVSLPSHTIRAPNTSRGIELVSGDRAGTSRPSGGGNVIITDEFGRVIAVQYFDSLREAQEFTSDFNRQQNRQRQLHTGNVIQVKGQF